MTNTLFPQSEVANPYALYARMQKQILLRLHRSS